MNYWIAYVRQLVNNRTHLEFSDGTILIVHREKFSSYFKQFYIEDNGEIVPWLSDRQISFNPDYWDQETKVLFQLTFG